MKISILCIIYSILLATFELNVSAHPHKSGKIDHGQSLEKYQIKLNLTNERSTKYLQRPNTSLANKQQKIVNIDNETNGWLNKLDLINGLIKKQKSKIKREKE